MKAGSKKVRDIRRSVLSAVALILAASATVSCDKLKPRPPSPPLPETELSVPALPQVTAPKGQAPGASAVR